jgi:hypothetical protein
MMISDVIRNAESEYVIYFLLDAYIETVQFSAKLPERLTNLPIIGLNDVRTRFQQLVIELEKASKQLDDKACPVIKEALHIFGAALSRLRSLDAENDRSIGGHLPECSMGNVPQAVPDSVDTPNIS